MCSRNYYGGATREHLSLTEWSVQDAEKVFNKDFSRLRNILFCGTHGDPGTAKDTLGIIEVARRNCPQATIEFYSNASVKTPNWWTDLAKLLQFKGADDHYRKHDIAVFSIDGLADTNHLYRRRTNFEKVMENAAAFIAAGGHARWDYLVFKHNEHQVEEAEVLAKKMGFKHFRIRKTSRFAYSPDGPDRFPVLDNKGQLEYYLEPPTDAGYVNNQSNAYQQLVTKERSGAKSITKQINCLYKNEFGRMYVNADLKVYPCCFVSSDTYADVGRAFEDTRLNVLQKYGEGFNSLREKSWNEIMAHPWYARDLVESWQTPDNSLVRCQRTCGVEASPILSQSSTVQL